MVFKTLRDEEAIVVDGDREELGLDGDPVEGRLSTLCKLLD